MNDYKIPFYRPDISENEIKAVTEVLNSGWLTTGKMTRSFEKQIALCSGTEQAICVSCNSAGLELVLRLLGVGAGDEVITSSYTYVATATVTLNLGAHVFFADVIPGTYLIDPCPVKNKITLKTKVVISVDIGGVCQDKKQLIDVLKYANHTAFDNPIPSALGRPALISDLAHSFGTLGCGEDADFTVFSFHVVKSLTIGEVKVITWNLPNEIAPYVLKQLRRDRLQGVTRDTFTKKSDWNWGYDIVELSIKCNMPDILVAIGLSQICRYDTIIAKRQSMYRQYKALLSSDILLLNHDLQPSNYHLLMAKLPYKDVLVRNKIIHEMYTDYNIQTNVHFKPLPMMKAFRQVRYNMEDHPQAYDSYVSEITLPLYDNLTENQVERVCASLNHLLEAHL